MDTPDWLQFVVEPAADGAGASASASAHSPPSPSPSSEKPVHDKTLASLLPSTRTEAATSIPTPPDSNASSPVEETEEPSVVSVSTTFYPNANLHHSSHDIVLVSSDAVFFYVHSVVLLRGSSNRFNSLVSSTEEVEEGASSETSFGPVLAVPEASSVLNVVLHTLYSMSSLHYAPCSETLFAAVDALARYGADLKKQLAPNTPLFQQILGNSPTAAVESYAIAGHYDLWELAVAVSPYMLSFPLTELEDRHVERMGPFYLKRLFFLHLGRVDALKRLLLPPPQGHPATLDCDFTEQKKLTRAWALASAYLAWDARPDLSTTSMEVALRPLGDHLTCTVCRSSLHERIKVLLVQWALVKRTV